MPKGRIAFHSVVLCVHTNVQYTVSLLLLPVYMPAINTQHYTRVHRMGKGRCVHVCVFVAVVRQQRKKPNIVRDNTELDFGAINFNLKQSFFLTEI